MQKNNEQVSKELGSLEKWYDVQEKLANHYTKLNGHVITRENIFNGLFIRLADKYHLEWQGDLWDLEITYEEALNYIKDFDFAVFNQKVTIDSSIIPSDLILKYKVRIKSKGLIWVIHLNDKDPFPSNPHAHQLDNNLKLDLSNGKCYKSKKFIYKINKKDLLIIRKEANKVFKGDMPVLTE